MTSGLSQESAIIGQIASSTFEPSGQTDGTDIRVLDPLTDRCWDELVGRHERSSVFHQRSWLEALSRTYGYAPLVITDTPAGSPLTSGVVLCRISSWITGTRLVSLPFADHCEPLLNKPGEALKYTEWLSGECKEKHLRYFELRPLSTVESAVSGLLPSRSYLFHELDLQPDLNQLFQQLHKNCFQRKIRRAERERLSYEVGRSKELVDEFYRLTLLTRRRHHLLPQPRIWFRNLVECMGDDVQIRVARKNGTPVAAILTLRHRSTLVYKYGASDANLHRLGGMPFLFWKLIQEGKASGAEKIDLGRSDLDQAGPRPFQGPARNKAQTD